MSLDMVRACIAGYSDRLLDEQLVALQTGYWAGYYNNAKHPKSVKSFTEAMLRTHNQQDATKTSAPKPDVDVEAFLAKEAKFKARLVQNG